MWPEVHAHQMTQERVGGIEIESFLKKKVTWYIESFDFL